MEEPSSELLGVIDLLSPQAMVALERKHGRDGRRRAQPEIAARNQLARCEGAVGEEGESQADR